MDSQPGSYVVILRNRQHVRVEIGRLRTLKIDPGYFIYVGSAFGPGGVRARVLRHSRKAKALHWHVDYLREKTGFDSAWYSHDPRKLEHAWAEVFSRLPGYSAIEGFGCSDCRCHSHLFFNPVFPDISEFLKNIEQPVKIWKPGPVT